jgi:hypothetical protein
MALTSGERRERHDQLLSYIRRTKTMDEAKALAREDGVRAPTTAWISAYGKHLASRRGDE